MLSLDTAFFDRVERIKRKGTREQLVDAVMATPGLCEADAGTQGEITQLINDIWSDAEASFDFNYPENLVRYTLTIMCQARWSKNQVHFNYARQMMGTPDQPWRLESGIVAMYENVVAPHYLAPSLVTFVANQGAGTC